MFSTGQKGDTGLEGGEGGRELGGLWREEHSKVECSSSVQRL